MPDEGDLTLRRARAEDREDVVDLCRTALLWNPAAPNAEFFRWKHDDNPFGPSPMWIALDEEQIVGARVFLRWRFRHPSGRTANAVRAVDAATHPSARRRGIFTRLTLAALEELSTENVSFVFNTPNAQSGPGNEKLGWRVVGRTSLAIQPRAPRSLARMARSRTGADKWSEPTDVGEDPLEVFAEDVEGLAPSTRHDGWATDRSAAYHRWRYSFEPLHYRVFLAGSSLADGIAVFRLHRRGNAMEATIVDTLGAPIGFNSWRRLLRETGADYLIRGSTGWPRVHGGFVPLPRAGPLLTQRQLDPTRLGIVDDFDLSLSEIELF